MTNITQLAYQTMSDFPSYMGNGYNYQYQDSSSAIGDAIAAIIYALYFGFFFLAYYVTMGISLMEIGKKMGYKNIWFAWVPVLNIIMRLNLAGFSGWYIFIGLINLIPVLGWIGFTGFYIYIWMEISKKCGKPDYLGLIMLIPLGNIILPLYLAYSKEEKIKVENKEVLEKSNMTISSTTKSRKNSKTKK